MRILFLDDDPRRAQAFADTQPEMVWVKTAEECLDRLVEPWDEVHLDHDLGGEAFVDHDRDDCGMEIVRWLCEVPRDHLRYARFFIHTHNENAACIMALHLEVMGYRVKVQPFGRRSSAPLVSRAPVVRRGPSRMRKLLDWFSGKNSLPRAL